MAKVIMIQGTMSNAGKSLLTAGLCRIFSQDGYKTAPFKSQNMALNSFITKEGLEMGRAQVVQAQAAGTKPSVRMNPILLKPTGDMGSQVIVNGIPIGNMAAKDYFKYKKELLPEIQKAYDSLNQEYDIIVIEGAGSPAEINLKQDDIVNMGMAKLAGAPVLLAGDIDRGGVFAQLYGTTELLEKEEKSLIKGLIINKFRGDKTILEPGIGMLEKLCGISVVGVVPLMEVDIEDEDSLSSRLEETECAHALVDIAVIRFPRLSNFTDMNVFSRIAGVSVRYVKQENRLGTPDLVILPGTKNTIEDLMWMRQNGLEAAVKKLADRGVPVFGVCGGYQMMGRQISDPMGVETQKAGNVIEGMGLFPFETRFEEAKTRTLVSGSFGQVEGIFKDLSGMQIEGYEIHMGITEKRERAFLQIIEIQDHDIKKSENHECRKSDGMNCGNLYGTYIHGVFDGEQIAEKMVYALLEKKGISRGQLLTGSMSTAVYREQQFDKLAAGLRESLDMEMIYRILEEGV